jgi:hypothetical protein
VHAFACLQMAGEWQAERKTNITPAASLVRGLLAAFAGLDGRQQGEPVVRDSSAQPDFSPPSLDQQDDGLHKGK